MPTLAPVQTSFHCFFSGCWERSTLRDQWSPSWTPTASARRAGSNHFCPKLQKIAKLSFVPSLTSFLTTLSSMWRRQTWRGADSTGSLILDGKRVIQKLCNTILGNFWPPPHSQWGRLENVFMQALQIVKKKSGNFWPPSPNHLYTLSPLPSHNDCPNPQWDTMVKMNKFLRNVRNLYAQNKVSLWGIPL